MVHGSILLPMGWFALDLSKVKKVEENCIWPMRGMKLVETETEISNQSCPLDNQFVDLRNRADSFVIMVPRLCLSMFPSSILFLCSAHGGRPLGHLTSNHLRSTAKYQVIEVDSIMQAPGGSYFNLFKRSRFFLACALLGRYGHTSTRF